MRLFLLCGPKGAGKTTCLQRMATFAPSRVRYIPSEALFLEARDAHAARAADSSQTASIYANEGTSWVDAAYDLIADAVAAAESDGFALAVCESTGTPPQRRYFARARMGRDRQMKDASRRCANMSRQGQR